MLALKRMTEIYLSLLLYIDHFMHYSRALIILKAEEVHRETWENSGRHLLFLMLGTVNGELKFIQNRSKNRF